MIEPGLRALRAALRGFTVEAEQEHLSGSFNKVHIKATRNGVRIKVRVAPGVIADAAVDQAVCDYIANKIKEKYREATLTTIKAQTS